jgi:hypothetical protein
VRTGLLDIETFPSLGYFWGLWDQNIGINQIKVPSEMVCFAWKWLGEPNNTTVYFSTYHNSKQEMLTALHALMDEADAIIHYNGKNFDMRWIRTEFALARMDKPSPWVDIDLLTIVKKEFRFESNKLDYVLQRFGLRRKRRNDGFALWLGCMNNDPKSWARFRLYNIQDVTVMEPLYNRVLGWISGHPNVALIDGVPDGCTNCGSTRLQRRGVRRTAQRAYQQFRCMNCGKWMRSPKSEPSVSTMVGIS